MKEFYIKVIWGNFL